MSYKEGEINELQQKIESQKEVSIDDAVVAPAPLYNQYVLGFFFLMQKIFKSHHFSNFFCISCKCVLSKYCV